MGVVLSRRELLAVSGLAAAGGLLFPDRASVEDLSEVIPIVLYDVSPVSSLERSWYSTSPQPYGESEATSYYFDGNSVGIELSATSSVSSASFGIVLYQGSRSRGSATLRASGFVRTEWLGVEPGTYSSKYINKTNLCINYTDVDMFS